jgi:exo-beta-1,3-glucanase (GH17 family)
MAKLKFRAQSATVILCILLANVVGWFLINQPVQGQAWLGEIASLSFAGYQPDQSPLAKPPKYPSYDQLDRDLQKISKVASAVRTYSAINGLEKVPEIARKYGMTVTAGAWVAEKETREAELASLIQMAKRNRNVTQLVVGNEHILTGAPTVPEQIAKPASRSRPRRSGPTGSNIPSSPRPATISRSTRCLTGRTCRSAKRSAS